ncbi:MAG: ATP-dependent zinc metalloprotease FtsH, partial [Acutalibacteraceae bacterium]|nr:ATP-dependent zinc metalloprotease FtsH [Acutalibacteraceae bacterium]
MLFVAVPLLLVIMMAVMWGSNLPTTKMNYSDFMSLFREDKIAEFSLDLSSRELNYTLRSDTKTVIKYVVPDSSLFIQDWKDATKERDELIASGKIKTDGIVKYDFEHGGEGSWLISLLPTILMIAIFIVGMIFISRKMNNIGGNDRTLNFGKMRIKSNDDKKKTKFTDVAGADEEKEELVEIVEFLKNPQKFNELGARIPKGVLLVGPPGTGKTLLAKAVAGEAGVPFFSISGSDFVEMFVGVGASRVRDLFDQAKKNAPAIIFIDEIDAVGRQRGAGLGGGHDEREQTLNQLLVEMDGFGENEGVIVMAATNRADILDKALLRPGRFDRQIAVNPPDVKGREEILKIHARGKPLGPDVNLKTIAKKTAGFTGADLENLLNEAALLAARQGKKSIVQENIDEATIKVVMGPEKKSHVITDRDKWITAYHEAGHAIVSYNLPTQDPVHQISIIPRGFAAGYTMYIPDNDDKHVSRNKMIEDICSLLGGRAAEELTQDDICTGASNDIQRATENARAMVTKYGFSEKIGPIALGHDQGEVFLGRDFSSTPSYSEKISAVIDEEIERIVTTQYD